MLSKKALPLLRKNLAIFIAEDPIYVQLERQVKVESGAGGYLKLPADDIRPQQFRLVPFKRRLSDVTKRTANGHIPVQQFALIGRHTVDIRRDDEFIMNGNRYRVVSIEPQTEDRSATDRVVAMIEVQIGDKTNLDLDGE